MLKTVNNAIKHVRNPTRHPDPTPPNPSRPRLMNRGLRTTKDFRSILAARGRTVVSAESTWLIHCVSTNKDVRALMSR